MVESGSTKILLDAGVKLGSEDQFPKITDEELRNIDAIFISHAHLDHCGYVPHIYSAEYCGELYATKPTLELMQVLISDYMRISEPSNVSKKGLSEMLKHQRAVEYKREVLIKDLKITFIPAGHILGSALIRVTDGKNTLVYTGDINLAKTKLLNGADLKNLSGDVLITESTYGGKTDIFESEVSILKSLVYGIKDTIKNGGKVVIPSFAVGRAQEVLLSIDDYINSGAIPKVPIYVDGMINKALRIHRHNVIYCRKELQSRILMSDFDPFKSPNFVPVEKKGTRNAIVASDESSIIVTTSGMITGGPITFYLQKMAGNSLNKLILVGYQAEGTIGRQLQDGEKSIEIDGKRIKIEMGIEMHHLSAHADRKQLEQIPQRIAGIKKIFIVHGEYSKALSLKEELSKRFETEIPELGHEYSI